MNSNADTAIVPATYTAPVVFFQSPKLRFRIVSAYWLVILLGLPLWWITTSIERLPLPAERVGATSAKEEVRFPVDLVVEPSTTISAQRLAGITQSLQRFLEDDRKANVDAWRGLDVNIRNTVTEEVGKSTYKLHFHEIDAAQPSSNVWISGRELHIRQNASQGDVSLAHTSAAALSDLLAPYSTTNRKPRVRERLVAQYADRFRLAFSLLNEDASAGEPVLGWDQKAAILQYIAPVLSQLSALYNFTVESQVQFHAPLAFEPLEVVTSNGVKSHVLGDEELKVFVNSAEWTLASIVSEDPVLHFVLFHPSNSHRPLAIQSGDSHLNSFIVPQWGSVVILDSTTLTKQDGRLSSSDLEPIFKLFRSQLLTLLGVPTLPSYIFFKSDRGQISEWQLDALLRRRTIENIKDSKEALSSIVKLVDQISGMPVGSDVRDDVQGAIDAIDQAYLTASKSPEVPLQHSARANTLSSRAFFNPGMLAMLYFPPEHRFAVYLPLFGPISMPLLVGLIREVRRRRDERRQRAEAKKEE